MGGLFGVVSKKECIADLFYGTDYHSHLGTKYGGLAVKNKEGFTRHIHDITKDPFRSKFENDIQKMDGNKGIGIISDSEPQPLIIKSHLGTYAIVTVGKINNINELAKIAFKNKTIFTETSKEEINPTELIANLISQEATLEDGIKYANDKIKGSCSLLLLTKEGIYAARDKLGRTPIVIGKKQGSYAATSETSAFPTTGFEIEKYLGPGEIVLMTPEGVEQKKSPNNKMQICSFLYVYFGFPVSNYEDINVEIVRNKLGKALAKNDKTEIDMIAGIPDSGTGSSLGYANERKEVPLKRPFVKYSLTWPRSFMPPDQKTRDLIAKMKLIPNKELIQGQRILFCEDSIVRGTQLQDIIQMLYDNYRALEIHMRPSCPPLIYKCDFINFSRSRSELELAARKSIRELEGKEGITPEELAEYSNPDSEKYHKMNERTAQRLRLTTLKYPSLDELVEAIGLPKEKLCTHCWDCSSYF